MDCWLLRYYWILSLKLYVLTRNPALHNNQFGHQKGRKEEVRGDAERASVASTMARRRRNKDVGMVSMSK